jgi:hypothetical protein
VRAACAIAVLLVLLGAVPPAGALEIGLWPLFSWANDPGTGSVRWSALGPLVAYRSTPSEREFLVRPLVRVHEDRESRDVETDLAYPIAATHWRRDEWSLRFLLFTARGRIGPPPAGAPITRFVLFPLVFYRERAEDTDLGVLPFYLDLHDAFGWSRVRAIAFPLFFELDEPRVRRTWTPFPFVSVVGGEDGSGLHVFPFYGRTDVAGTSASGYLLWPFFTWADRTTPDGGVERRRVLVPFFASLEGPDRTMRAYGLTGYTTSIDRRRGTESTGSPWPLVVREREIGGSTYDTWRLFPIYGRSSRDGITRRFYLWPALRSLAQDDGAFHFRRHDAMLVAWRRERDWDDATGRTHGLDTLVGLWRVDTLDGLSSGQVPAVFDAIAPHARGVRALWAPLTALVRWDTRPEATDWSLLFDLVAHRDGRLLGPWYVHDESS